MVSIVVMGVKQLWTIASGQKNLNMKGVLYIRYGNLFDILLSYDCYDSIKTIIIIPEMDPETMERKGMYQHPIIQKAVNVMWFQNKRDEGIRYKDMFKPIPIPAIALVLTAVSVVCFQI